MTEAPGPSRFAIFLHRAMRFARGLGFVFLIYFIPVVVRDLIGFGIEGGAWLPLVDGTATAPFLALAVVLGSFALSVVAVLLYRLVGPEAVDPLPHLSLGPRWRTEFGLGVAMGLAAATVAVLPAFVSGHLSFEGFRGVARWDILIALVLVLLMEATREELAFRGPPQRELTGALSFPLAAVFLTGSFTVLHAANPDVTREGLLGVFFAGMALAGMARARGDLGMVCGAHAGWNLSLALVYSAPVSGLRSSSALLDVASTGSGFWTGGAFGTEASVPGLVVLAVAGFLTWRLPARSGPNDSAPEDGAPEASPSATPSSGGGSEAPPSA